MDAELGVKRARSSNFSSNEKSHLINIIAKYKNIIENKETDKNTNFDKNSAWERVTTEFNATSPANIYRTKDSIKRFYENKKKELRKKVADGKMEQKKTGGGLPPPAHDEPFEDVLLSITNKKTVYGLETPYGGDVSSDEEVEPQNDIEFVYEYDRDDGMNEDLIIEEDMHSPLVVPNNWKKYKPTDLQKPKSFALRTEKQKENDGLDINQAINYSDVTSEKKKQTEAGSGTGKERNTLEKNIEQVITPKKNWSTRTTPASNRRRPTIQVKALTSTEVSKKYNQLLDMRLEVADFTKKRLAQELDQSNQKHEKEMELLDLQISVEKERLNNLKRRYLAFPVCFTSYH